MSRASAVINTSTRDPLLLAGCGLALPLGWAAGAGHGAPLLAATLAAVAMAIVLGARQFPILAMVPPALAAMLQGSYAWLPYLSLVPLLLVVVPHSTRSIDASSQEQAHAGDAVLRLSALLLVALSAVHAIRTQEAGIGLLIQIAYLGFTASLVAPFFRRFGSAATTRSAVVITAAATAAVYLVDVVPTALSQGAHAWAFARENPTWANPNTLGLYFLIALAVPLRAIAAGRGRPSSWISAVLLAAATAGTFSRSAYIGLAVMVLILLGRSRRALIVLGPPLIVLILNLPSVVVDRIQYTSATGVLDASSGTRLKLWAAAGQIALDNPLTGVGIHNLGGQLEAAGAPGTFAFAHNSYLTAAASFGLLIPLLIASIVVVRLARRAWARTQGRDSNGHDARPHPPRQRVPSEFALALAATLVCSFFGEPLLSPIVFLPLIALFVVREQVR